MHFAIDGVDLTPTKSVSRVSPSTKSKEGACILCAEYILDSNFCQRLFIGLAKSPACMNLEILVGAKLERESCSSGIICKNCVRSNENIVKKVLGIRKQFALSKERLAVDCGIESVKRQSKDSSDQSRSKRALVFSETIESAQPIPFLTLTEKSTQTISWPDNEPH